MLLLRQINERWVRAKYTAAMAMQSAKCRKKIQMYQLKLQSQILTRALLNAPCYQGGYAPLMLPGHDGEFRFELVAGARIRNSFSWPLALFVRGS